MPHDFNFGKPFLGEDTRVTVSLDTFWQLNNVFLKLEHDFRSSLPYFSAE